MNIEQIKELIAILEGSKLNKMSFKDEKGCELHLEKSSAVMMTHPPTVHSSPTPVVEAHPSHPATHVVQTAKHQEVVGKYITSPMVGTFYLTAAPSEPAFIKIGDDVTENSVVCIIEAMKVMNEIKAGVRGKLVEICIENGHAVEFGTKLFRVE